MKKLVVAFDLDGVVVDWYGELLRHLPAEIHIPLDGIKTFWVENNYPKEWEEKILHTITAPGFYDALKPIDGAVEVLNRLYDDPRYHVYLCSAPETRHSSQACWSEKARWVSRYLGERWLDRLMLVKDKSLAHCDVLVDDKPEMDGFYLDQDRHTWHRFVYAHNYNAETPGTRVSWPYMEHALGLWHEHQCSTEIVLTDAQWEHFEKTMRDPAPPTPALLEGHRLLNELRKKRGTSS